MAKHTEIGRKGEQIAVKFLKNKGYEVLAQNWRHGKKEVDIVASIGSFLVFAEVKTRSSFEFGFPEESVTALKKSIIKEVAAAYCDECNARSDIRFDIISVCLTGDHPPAILHIEDAFF